MKKIIAIIRNECVEPSRSALEQIGIRGVAYLQVMWQRQQSSGTGISSSCDPWHTANHDRPRQRRRNISGANDTGCADGPKTESLQDFLPGTMLMMAVIDEDVLPVIQALLAVNQDRYPGDGRIVVCPMVTNAGIFTGNSREAVVP